MTDLAIRLAGVRKTYGPVTALNGIDLEIERGRVVAILGPNGAGKSTTLNTVLGLTRPDAGTLEVLGGPPRAALAAGRVGAMLQDNGLVDEATIADLLRAFASWYPSPRPVEEVLERAGLTAERDRRVLKLSGGQKQRVRFALTLIGDPELLIFDEPTVGMDVASRQAFWDELRRLAEDGRTIVFATHYLAEADAYADRIALITEGRVVAEGSGTEIKNRVPGRAVHVTLDAPDAAAVAALPGVTDLDVEGTRVHITSTDADATLRALLAKHDDARDIEVGGVDLEAAFVALTRGEKVS
ncbi:MULTISPECIES: ABC transporter ATP-binding protein [Actinomadura]|uniref:ABC transporter ATP-binding protein n=1 Tax=Actinomadura TaxID=1988 RepID=UPI00041FC662|nr:MULTISPECIES: ABC transporter ATP-binding protein [Actinomadura]RSN69234.1 ABC transporter ATP-binding protein [Actinomadura sp. WAC 06369]